MKKPLKIPVSTMPQAAELHKQAEKKLRKQPGDHMPVSPGDAERLLHELQVHQLELEMQNDELRRTKAELEASRESYFQWYDLAPVGYLTISEKGLILQSNLRAAALLGMDRSSLRRQPLSRFCIPEDTGMYYLIIKKLFATGDPQESELRMKDKSGALFWAQVAATTVQDTDGKTAGRIMLSDITVRKQAEGALLQSNELMRTIVEHNRSGIAVLDRNLRYIYVSRRFLEDYRIAERDVIGREHYDVFPDLPQKWKEVHARALAGETSSAEDDPFIRSDGSVDWTRWECRPWHEEGGAVGGIIIYTEVITERKRAELALLESEERFRSLAEEMPHFVWEANSDGLPLYANKRFYDYSGLNPEQALAGGWLAIQHPEDIPIVEAAWHQAVTACAEYDLESRFREEATGAYRWFRIKGSPVRDAAGRIFRWVGTATDIHDQKKAEDALRESEERLRLAQEAAKIGAFEWNIQTGVNVWTPELEAMYGLAPGEFGKTQPSWEQLVYPEDLATAVGLCDQTLETGKPVEGEWRVVWCDGSVHWIAGRFQCFKDVAGKPLRLTGVNMDITKRKLAEEELRQNNAILDGINQILHAVMTCRTEEELGSAFLDIARKITQSSFGFIGQINKDGLEDIAISNPGWEACTIIDAGGHRRPVGNFKIHGIYGRVLMDGRSLFTNDPAHHPDSIGLPEGHPPLKSFLGVPMKKEGRVAGMFAVGNREGGYTQVQQNALEALTPVIQEAFMRIRAETALHESEERFRLMANAMPQLAWIAQPDGYITWYNQRWYEYTGTTPVQMEGWGWQNVHDPMALPEVLEVWKHSISTGEPFDMEFPLRGADGIYRPFLTRGYPLKNEAGRVEQWFGTNTDITERKQAEQELFNTQQRLQALLQALPVGVSFSDDASCTRITGNPAVMAQFEVSASDNLSASAPDQHEKGRLIKFFHNGRLITDAELPLQRAVAENSVIPSMELEVLLPSGKRWFADALASPVRDQNGTVTSGVAVTIDITERKRFENVLQESQERFAFAMEAMNAGLWDWDTITNKVYYSPRWKSMLGYGENEIGDGMDEFTSRLHPDDREHTLASIEKQLKDDSSKYSLEFRMRHKDGHYIDIHSRAFRVRDASGAIMRTIGLHTDITGRKAIEKAQLFLLQCGTKEGEDFFESLAGYLAENLGMDFVCIDKLMGDSLSAQTVAMCCDGKFEENIEYALKDTPCGDVVGKAICAFSKDVCRLFPKDAALQDLRAESYVGTTLWSMRGEPIGLIAVIGRKPLPDTSFAATILKLVALRAAAEMEHRAASEVLLKSNKAYQALSESGRAVVTARSETELMHEAVRIVQEVCGYSLAWIGLAEQDAGKTIRMAAQAGDINGYLDTVRITWGDDELGRGPTGTAIRTRQPVINHNTLTTPSLAPWRDRQREHGFLSSAAFPLCTDEEVLGALTVYAPTLYAFTKEESRLLMELSTNLAYGIQYMRMEKERDQAAKILGTSNARLNILAETASQLLKTESPQQIIEGLCRRVMTFLDCQAFFNFLVDEERDQLHLNACAGIPQEEAAKIEWLDYGVAVCGCAARDGCRIVAEDILHTPDIRTELVKSYGIQAYACHPLISQGEVIGTLSFGTNTRPHFTDDELSLMKAVADQVSIALERKESQSRIAELNLNLQHKLEKIEDEIRRRTLAEEILTKYAEDLAMSNEELDSFAAAVSHDLQEPLRSIAGFMRLIDKKYGNLLDSNGREYIERAMASSKRLGAMINSLLSYSRITTRGKEFEHHELDAVLQTALENLNSSISQTRALIISEPLPPIFGDPDQLVRVFQNLIGNSIKYCGSKRPEIHISWQRMGDSCIIAVKDNGEGIEPEYLANVFDIFTRVPSQHNIAGTGMGLAVCKKIISRHKGQLWAESEQGKGSTFFFSLPVR